MLLHSFPYMNFYCFICNGKCWDRGSLSPISCRSLGKSLIFPWWQLWAGSACTQSFVISAHFLQNLRVKGCEMIVCTYLFACCPSSQLCGMHPKHFPFPSLVLFLSTCHLSSLWEFFFNIYFFCISASALFRLWQLHRDIRGSSDSDREKEGDTQQTATNSESCYLDLDPPVESLFWRIFHSQSAKLAASLLVRIKPEGYFLPYTVRAYHLNVA